MQNLSEFHSGSDYDAQYSARYDPETKYLTMLASEQNKSILDVGCGTGIVTIPLAEAGFDVTGIDISEAMITHAKVKSKHLSNMSFHIANALNFELSGRFDLAIMTGNVFQAFLTELEVLQVLQNINKHLNSNGILVFGTRLLEGYDLTLDSDFKFWEKYTDASGNLVRYNSRKIQFDSENNILYYNMKRQYPDGTEVLSGIDLKFLPIEILLSLIEKAGFEVQNQYANWQLNSFDSKGENAVFKLRKL